MKRVLLSLLFFVFTCCVVAAEQESAHLSFDVASVKLNPGSEGHSHTGHHGGTFEMTNVTLKSCITLAYGLADAQVSGPAWLDSEKYDILAKAASDETDDQHILRLQTLLSDRFKLAFHRETREGSVYEIVIAKNGPKIKRDDSGVAGSAMNSQRGHVTATTVSMARLAAYLASPRASLGRPVIDKTGLEGVYSFTLDWTPDDSPAPSRPAEETRKQGERWPSMFVAIQEQLGLKLESRRAPIELLVVDHVERTPSEN